MILRVDPVDDLLTGPLVGAIAKVRDAVVRVIARDLVDALDLYVGQFELLCACDAKPRLRACGASVANRMALKAARVRLLRQ
jgi:hypothetical protein